MVELGVGLVEIGLGGVFGGWECDAIGVIVHIHK
jgi:hypothetical protein